MSGGSGSTSTGGTTGGGLTGGSTTAGSTSTGGSTGGTGSTTGGSTSGGTTGSGGDSAPSAPSGLTAQATLPRTVQLQWNDNSSDESGFRVIRDGFRLVATLPANSTSFTDTNLPPNSPITYYIEAFNGAGKSASEFRTVTTVNSQPVEWSRCVVQVLANAADPGTYYVRSSGSQTFSSSMTIFRSSGNVNFGDAFFLGQRGVWDVRTFSGTKNRAGQITDPETITYDSTSLSTLRLFNPDGTVRRSYNGSRLRFILRWDGSQYLMTVVFTPQTPDSILTGETVMCTDVALTATEFNIRYIL